MNDCYFFYDTTLIKSTNLITMIKVFLFSLIMLFSNITFSQCFLKPSGKVANYVIYDKTDDSEVNYIYSDVAELFSQLLDLNVKYGFFNDVNGPNAFAINSYNSNYDGEIYFGLNLLSSFNSNDKLINMIFVTAHEYGHIFQFKNNISTKRVKWKELQADYIAGAIFAWYYIWVNSKLKTHEDYDKLDLTRERASKLFWSMGDNNFTNPQHHGTPSQRKESFDNGFRHQISEYIRMKDYDLPITFSHNKVWKYSLAWSKLIKKHYIDD